MLNSDQTRGIIYIRKNVDGLDPQLLADIHLHSKHNLNRALDILDYNLDSDLGVLWLMMYLLTITHYFEGEDLGVTHHLFVV